MYGIKTPDNVEENMGYLMAIKAYLGQILWYFSNLGKLIATCSMIKIKDKTLIEIQSIASKHI